MLRIETLITLCLLASAPAGAQTVNTTVTVNCDRGESLNQALAKLNQRTSTTVNVKGTCAEYVQVRGFEGLTLKGSPGATLVQPTTPNTPLGVLTIDSSRSITVDGFKVQAPLTDFSTGVLVWRGSADVRLRNLTTEGGVFGILVAENSQVSIALVTGRDPGFAAVGIYDSSHVQVEDCLFEGHTGPGFFNAAIQVDRAHLNLHGTTIRNMQVGITVGAGGIINVEDVNGHFPRGGPSEVLIESPLGTNFIGLEIFGGAIVKLSAKLRITNAGHSSGGNFGAVVVRDNGTLDAGKNLDVSGSRGQGVYVTNNSHVSLAGSSITGGLHNGIVVLNKSTVAAVQLGDNSPTQISGHMRKDIFCDSRSLITGGANIANATNVQCGNLLAGASEPIP